MRTLHIALAAAALCCACALTGRAEGFPPRSLPIIAGVNDIGTLAPKLDARRVADQWRNDTYGIVVLKNGEIAAIHLGEGTPVLAGSVWYLQGQGKDANGKATFQHLDTPEHVEAPIDVVADENGNRVYVMQDVANTYLRWSKRIICMPRALRVELTFLPLKPIDPGLSPNLFTRVRVLAETTRPFSEPNSYPITIATTAGRAELRFPTEFSWYKGYWIEGKSVVFSPLSLTQWVPDQPVHLWYQIDFWPLPPATP